MVNDNRHITRNGILIIDDEGTALMRMQESEDSQGTIDVPLAEILKNFIGGAITLDVDGTRFNGRLECNEGTTLSIVQMSKKRLMITDLIKSLVDNPAMIDVRAGMTSLITLRPS